MQSNMRGLQVCYSINIAADNLSANGDSMPLDVDICHLF